MEKCEKCGKSVNLFNGKVCVVCYEALCKEIVKKTDFEGIQLKYTFEKPEDFWDKIKKYDD